MTRKEINKLDKKFREVINERDNHICAKCGNYGNNVHHLVGRRNRSVRWYPANGLTLCPGDHTFRTDSFHQNPLATMEWFKEKYPDRYEAIRERQNKILKQTYEEVMGELDETNKM